MKRLVPTLTALVIAVAGTLVWPSKGAAVLDGDELACAGGSAQEGVEYAEKIVPKLHDACLENEFGLCKPEEADVEGDHDDFVGEIVDACQALPDSFEGFCGGDPIEDIAECVADAYEAGATMVADSSIGGGLPPPQVVTIFEPVLLHCSVAGDPCFGPGVTGCCRGLVCRVRSSEVNGEFIFTPTCVPAPSGYSSAVRAFIDTSRSLLD
jgi:hypothetical protein